MNTARCLHLLGRVEVGDEVSAVLGLLESREHHLGSGDVLLGVEQVGEEVLVVPGDSGLRVGLGVREAGAGSGVATAQAEQGGTLLVASASLDGVALKTRTNKQTDSTRK